MRLNTKTKQILTAERDKFLLLSTSRHNVYSTKIVSYQQFYTVVMRQSLKITQSSSYLKI